MRTNLEGAKEIKIIKDEKILLVIPRQQATNMPCYTYTFPVGLAYISAVLKKEGYTVNVLNLNHLYGTTEKLINSQLKENYDFICIGNSVSGYNITKDIIDTIRNYKKEIKIILGGMIIISEPKLFFNLLNPDYAVIGEGEETIIELLDFIKKNKNLKKVKGIAFRDKDGELFFTEEREPQMNLDLIPFPDWEGFGLDEKLEKLHPNQGIFYSYLDNPRPYPIMASRGCPFNCTFCYHYQKYRKRSIENVMKELRFAVKRFKINLIHIYDEVLALDKDRLYKLCEEIKKLKKEFPWEIKLFFQLTVLNVDKKMLKMMKGIGVEIISYGLESFSPVILKSMRKPITPKMIEKVVKETMEAKITIQGGFIFGDVAETKDTIKETLDWWKENSKGQIDLNLICPYPKSEIYNHCLKNGIIEDEEDYLKNNISKVGYYNMTNNLSNKEYKQLKKELENTLIKYVKRVKPISFKKINKNIYELEVKCPFCGEITNYKNCFIKNKHNYDFPIACRKCNLRFYVIGYIKELIYHYYTLYRLFRRLYKT